MILSPTRIRHACPGHLAKNVTQQPNFKSSIFKLIKLTTLAPKKKPRVNNYLTSNKPSGVKFFSLRLRDVPWGVSKYIVIYQ